LIDGVFEERPGVRIANEQPPILNIDVLVENGVGRGVHVGDKSVLVECDRGQPHRIERGDRRCGCFVRTTDGGDLDQALCEEARMRSSSARRLQTSESISKIVIPSQQITVLQCNKINNDLGSPLSAWPI